MKTIILFLCGILFLLTGCNVVPVKQKFPDVPVGLLEQPRQLSPIPKTKDVKLSEFMSIIVHNNTQCHANAIQLESWIEWYSKHKKNFEKLD